MSSETAKSAEGSCPFCALWASYKKSEAAQHVQAIRKETLLLIRSVLDGCIKAAEAQMAAAREKEKS